MTYKFKNYYIPDRMMEGIKRYIEHGIAPGSFLEAIICNNLRLAVENADSENMANIPAYVGYFYNEAPIGCWGSNDNYRNWLTRDPAE